MCQEYHCDCCSDELPGDSCECVECYHGDQVSEDVNHFLRNGEIAPKYNSGAICCGNVYATDSSPSRTCCGEEKMTSPSSASSLKQPKSCCEDGKDSFTEEMISNPCPSSSSKQSQSCCDSDKDSCKGEKQTIVCPPVSTAKQSNLEAADPCRSKCCSDVIDEVGGDAPVKSDCCSQQKSRQVKDDTCCEKTPRVLAQDAASSDSTPRRGCCS